MSNINEDKSKSDKDNSSEETKGRSELRETITTLVWALGLAFLLRTFLFQPFHIPSGSMEPGLVKGDYIITTKYSLGYGQFAATPIPFPVKSGRLFERKPTRGDVIVFRPDGLNKNYIKRLVGLPGDEIQMIDGRLHINREIVPVKNLGSETRLNEFGNEESAEVLEENFTDGSTHKIYDVLKSGNSDNTETFTVPAGHYFFMGDNRDRSADSRVPVGLNGAGYVPTENLMGKARIVLLSVNENFSIFKPWTWFHMRKSRFFKAIK